MAGERIKLEVTERERLGSRETRRLRKQGLIPGVIYGRTQPRAIAIPEREFRRALSGAGGTHVILDVVVGGGSTQSAVLKDFQQDRVRGGITHVDLHEVPLDELLTTVVAVQLVGGEDAPGVREGGVLAQVTREVNVEALPLEVPEHLELDVSGMNVGDSLRVADLPPREGVTYLDDPDTVLVSVTTATPTIEPEELLEGAEAEAGIAPPPGDEAPEGGSEAPAEPGAPAAGGEGTVPG